MRADILRQNFGKFGQIVLQLFGKHIGRVDDEHAAAVHTENRRCAAYGHEARRADNCRERFLSSSGSLRAFFAQAGIPNHVAAGFKAF